jgi:hypothetical protein
VKKEEIVANCIDDILSGKSTLESCIACHPELAEELRSLLEIASNLKPDQVQASTEFKQRTRRRLFEEMQDGEVKTPRFSWPGLAPVRALVLSLIVLAAICLAGGGTVLAAQNSLPGDTLYTVKTHVEDIRMALTPGAEARVNLHLKMAQIRIDEANRLVQLNRQVDARALQTIGKQYDEAIREISKSAGSPESADVLDNFSSTTLDQELEIQKTLAVAPGASQNVLNHTLDLTRRGNLIARVAYSNSDYLRRQPSVSDEKLDSGPFEIAGSLLSITGRTWNVGGVILQNVHLPASEPTIGSRVQLEGIVRGNEIFISKIMKIQDSNQTTKVQGQVGTTNKNGATDISGLPIEIADSGASTLKPGDNVQLQGSLVDGKLKVTGQERRIDMKNNGTSIKGVLTDVNVIAGTLKIKISASPITVNVNHAQVKNDKGQTRSMIFLSRLLGQEITLEGLQKNGKSLYAARVVFGEKDKE